MELKKVEDGDDGAILDMIRGKMMMSGLALPEEMQVCVSGFYNFDSIFSVFLFDKHARAASPSGTFRGDSVRRAFQCSHLQSLIKTMLTSHRRN